jgi:hypothetical protein
MARFAKGTPKPSNSGRRAGTPNKNSMRARMLVAEARDRKIIDGVVTSAEGGDPAARATYFRYVRPSSPRAGTFLTPIDYKVPTTVEEAHATVLELGGRLAEGKISVEAHDALVSGLRIYLAAKAADQERRLQALEERAGVIGAPGRS